MQLLRLFPSLLLFILGVCMSCSPVSSVEFQTREISSLISLDIPNYLNETTELNEDAVCQFQNSPKDFCMIVRKNSWEELQRRRPEFVLEDFYDVSIEQLKGNMERIDAPAPDSLSLNGLPTFLGTLSGIFKGDKIVFNIGTIAGNTHLFQLLIWTTEEERELYKEDIDRVILSFKEIAVPPPPPVEIPIQTEEIQSDPLLQP